MENLTYKDILARLGYFRNKKNLSSREMSLRLFDSTANFNRIERGLIDLRVKTLLEFLDIVDVSLVEFFYPKPENYAKDKEFLEIISTLSEDKRQTLLDVAKKMK